MASAFAHAFAAASLAAAVVPSRWLPRVLVAGILCSVLPDLDVIGLALGVDYGDFWGHRGASHSLLFAAVAAAVVAPSVLQGADRSQVRHRVYAYLFVVIASHGLFDAMTNGGLGVAFFSPLDDTRYFLPIRPVEVSPIGISAFFDGRPLGLLGTEAVWIALPWTVLCLLVFAVRRRVDRATGAVRESAACVRRPEKLEI